MTESAAPSLAALIAGVKAQAAAERKVERERDLITRQLAGEVSSASRRIRNIFADPANWTLRRHVTLIHKGNAGDTMLGNFAEFVHKTALDCRRLVRVEAPAQVDAIETVEGENWLAQSLQRPEAEPEDPIEVCMDVTLPECGGAQAPAVILTIHHEQGQILRAELFDEVRFASRDRRTFLEMPAGVDILPALSFDCRVQLKQELTRALERSE